MGDSYEVTLVSYGDHGQTQTESILAPGISLRVLPAARRRLGTERLSWEITDVVRKADLVHIHQAFTRSGEVGMLVSKLMDKQVCVTDHGGASSTLGQSLGVLELADRVTCYSHFGESVIGGCETPIKIVRGGVDDEFFGPRAEAKAVRVFCLLGGSFHTRESTDC